MCKNCGATKTELINGREVCAYCGTPTSNVSRLEFDVIRDYLNDSYRLYDTVSGKYYDYLKGKFEECSKKQNNIEKNLKDLRKTLKNVLTK